ncbi:chaperone modulator CbpM [Paenirhodobacter populi]|uniref:MerR family transcriptional regulator n=2 Tax=Paenirhodobacter populi TaxID=2306993 RepID=A0A443KM00_9RHOB|nr:chaperone modulator CbpM [Sinirhodobacter populi]RWR08245.1 hypothetical protein D2T32_08915 [Sinirhodobacter populi]RWR22056.1 hypothetical protein D2T30_06810 [Sinirhodobacter populi]RWR33858.1 hypothetical protein D2T29_06260 [Sinirhodobacter populi]
MMTETDILTRIDRLTHDRLTLCVTRSWVRPRRSQQGVVYDDTDLARLRLIVELTEDMAVNDEAVPLILNLIDEVTTLRRGMRTVEGALRAEGLGERLLARITAMQDDGRE